MCGDTPVWGKPVRVSGMNISSLVRVFAVMTAGWALPFSLPAATVVLFNDLALEVSGKGSVGWIGASAQKAVVNTVAGFGLAPLPGGNPTVMYLPGFSNTEGLLFDSGLVSGNGGGYYINQYTMIFDVYWADSSPWYAFYNAEGLNDNDADFFRRGSDGAIGIGNDGYFGSSENGMWNRIAFTVTNTDAVTTTVAIYLNGVALGNSVRVGGTDGRFSLYLSGVGNQTALFTDNNGETGPAYVAQFYFDDRVYSAMEIAALGGATAYAIPEPGTLGLCLLGVVSLAGFTRMRRRLHHGFLQR